VPSINGLEIFGEDRHVPLAPFLAARSVLHSPLRLAHDRVPLAPFLAARSVLHSPLRLAHDRDQHAAVGEREQRRFSTLSHARLRSVAGHDEQADIPPALFANASSPEGERRYTGLVLGSHLAGPLGTGGQQPMGIYC